MIYRPTVLLFPFAFSLLFGCADTNRQPTTRPSSFSEEQDKALRDPFNYGPKETNQNIDDDMPSVTGGSTGHFDKKSFDHDMNSVFNPK